MMKESHIIGKESIRFKIWIYEFLSIGFNIVHKQRTLEKIYR